MTTALFFAVLLVALAALLVAYRRTDRSPAARPANTRTRRPRPATPRAKPRKPIPGPFKGTVLAHRPGKCARCKGRILTNEYVFPTRRGWIGPCCH
ncbi:hypothetical protein AB0883_29665 [Micromonospora sp. NPDC047812]|uniref:hypothetical protein n=1 Tax=Micromonospora sp. NPDC047812 TaxID=3155742 RepID=UPI0034536907